MSAGLAEAVDLRLRSERAGRTEGCLEVAFPAGQGKVSHSQLLSKLAISEMILPAEKA